MWPLNKNHAEVSVVDMTSLTPPDPPLLGSKPYMAQCPENIHWGNQAVPGTKSGAHMPRPLGYLSGALLFHFKGGHTGQCSGILLKAQGTLGIEPWLAVC